MAFAVICCTPALAQSPAAFYAGKTIELIVSSNVGGGYDAYSRLVAQHIGAGGLAAGGEQQEEKEPDASHETRISNSQINLK